MLYALAAAFACGTGEEVAGRDAAVEVATQTALKGAIAAGLKPPQQQALQIQIAGLTAAVNAKAAQENLRQQQFVAKSAVQKQGSRSSLSKEDVAKLAEDAENLMATNLTASGANALAHSGVPSVAVTNLAWLCDGFNQAFGVDLRKATAPTAEQRAADFFQPPRDANSSAWERAEIDAERVVAKARSAGASMKTLVDDAATAVDHAMPPHDEDTHAAAVAAIAATVASDREIGGATLRGHLAEKAEQAAAATPFERSEAAAWASLEGNRQGIPEQAAAAGAAAERAASDAGLSKEEVRKVGAAAASVVLRVSLPQPAWNIGAGMQSEEEFGNEMSAQLGREGLVEQEVITEDSGHWRWLIVGLCVLAALCITGVVLGVLSYRPKQKKKRGSSIREASVEPNPTEEASLMEAALMSASTQLQMPQGPELLAFPDWQKSWQPGQEKEVTYQVPPGAKPGSTLLVDVGGGFAVPTLVPESAHAGMMLSLRR